MLFENGYFPPTLTPSSPETRLYKKKTNTFGPKDNLAHYISYATLVTYVEEVSPNMHGIISSVFLATPLPYVLPKILGLSPKILYLYCDKRRDIQ